MCYYRDGRTRTEARLCRDQDTEDGSTGVGGGALADLATLSSCWLASYFFLFFLVFAAGQQHPRQFPERRRLQARHFRFDLWKNTEDLEARNEKKMLLHNSLRTYPLALDGTLGIQSFQLSPVSIAAFPFLEFLVQMKYQSQTRLHSSYDHLENNILCSRRVYLAFRV